MCLFDNIETSLLQVIKSFIADDDEQHSWYYDRNFLGNSILNARYVHLKKW